MFSLERPSSAQCSLVERMKYLFVLPQRTEGGKRNGDRNNGVLCCFRAPSQQCSGHGTGRRSGAMGTCGTGSSSRAAAGLPAHRRQASKHAPTSGACTFPQLGGVFWYVFSHWYIWNEKQIGYYVWLCELLLPYLCVYGQSPSDCEWFILITRVGCMHHFNIWCLWNLVLPWAAMQTW